MATFPNISPAFGETQTIEQDNIVVKLGGGRLAETDKVDHAVGFSDIVSVGTKLLKGTPILKIHAARIDHAESAKIQVLKAIKVSDTPPKEAELVLKRVI